MESLSVCSRESRTRRRDHTPSSQITEGLGPSQRRLEHGTDQALDFIHQKGEQHRRRERVAQMRLAMTVVLLEAKAF